MGLHDSELSIVMEDYAVLDSTMDGQPFKAGHHAATLRRMLWREHLGLLPAQSLDASDDPNAQPPEVPNALEEGAEYDFVADPLGEQVWEMWTGRATTNTDVFRHLFRADPDDSSEYPCSSLFSVDLAPSFRNTIPPSHPLLPHQSRLTAPSLSANPSVETFRTFPTDTPGPSPTAVKTFADYQNFLPKNNIKQGHLHDPFMPVEEVRQKLDAIKGHLVWMPLQFLRDAAMAEKGLTINAYTESIYT